MVTVMDRQPSMDCERVVHIYFGSQTGTAEAFAHELREDAEAEGLDARVEDLEHFSAERFRGHRIVILVVANTGEGEPTDNAVEFFRWLISPSTRAGQLVGMSFTVFGLGDSNYANFNHVGEIVDGGIERLGGRRIYSRGVGDDSDDIVRDFQAWKNGGLWTALRSVFPDATSEHRASHAKAKEPILRMESTVADLPSELPGRPANVLARFYFESQKARVAHMQELRQAPSPDEGRATTHLVLNIKGNAILEAYQAGGTLELLPENSPQDVAGILPLLGLSEAAKPGDIGDLDCCVSFGAGGGEDFVAKPFPTPCSLREALTRYCDLRRAPSRNMLVAMRPHLEPDAQERVGRLLKDRGSMRILHSEVLAWSQLEFWSVLGVDRLDLCTFLLHCPRQRARPFTIASSPTSDRTEIHICSSLVSLPNVGLDEAVVALTARGIFPAGCLPPYRSQSRFGLCSEWIRGRLQPGDAVLVRIRPSPFKLPLADVPIVMVGAGAGVAPFRAFWCALRDCPKPRSSPTALFFGCQHRERDWLYRAEMTAMTVDCSIQGVSKGPKKPLSHLFLAFSREGECGVFDPSGCCGEYVQDQLRARAADLREWLDESSGGVLYICGSTPMGQSVLQTLRDILVGGEVALEQLRLKGRIIQELWGTPPSTDRLGDTLSLEAGDVDGIEGTASATDASRRLGPSFLEAVKSGNHKEMERLIEAGVDLNFQPQTRKYTRIGLRQEVGETALHWAALRSDEIVATRLLSLRAEPDIRDQDGKSPLHIAAFNGAVGVARLLLEGRCDSNCCDLRGNSALHWTILAGGSMRMAKLLLKYGALGDLRNEEGECALDMAVEQGADGVASLIRENLASERT